MLPVGKRLAFAALGERRCLGVRRAGRWIVCPYAAVLDGASAKDQCARCAQLDRSRSVAADTMADDPRPYGVYLAYFGPGLLKVGITAVERGPARLVEQGAVAYAWLGRGPLMAARRTEALLGSALAVPDRFGKAAKRAARGGLPPVSERIAELAQLHDAARGLVGWPETLTPVEFACTDHTELFGLDRIPCEAVELGGLTAGAEIVGEVLTGVGSDVYLRLAGTEGAGGAVAVLDTWMLSGWALGAATGRTTTVPVRDAVRGVGERQAPRHDRQGYRQGSQGGRGEARREGRQEGLF
ncbi:DUF2797 domain-containing protein [Streptomyces sp. NPDC001339]|uniref:DUF2797 domain-containing protein n=1 Tax=Streptomyces sp. NPDC001339 TaxID=3364563 RepID=UPI003675ECC9